MTHRWKLYVDTIASGIIDPTKVVRVALQDAASIVVILITTEAMIAERPRMVRQHRRWLAAGLPIKHQEPREHPFGSIFLKAKN